jgi:hypothetical protein
MDNLEPQAPKQKSEKGYGKRPAWQWVLIYLVVATIVYGLIYYIFIRNGGGGNGY